MMTESNEQQGFGIHLMLDLGECNSSKLADLDAIFCLLDTLPATLGMTKVTPPYVFRYSGKVAEDKGITGFVVISESHVSIHTFQEKEHAFVDVFSCRPFDCAKAERAFVEALGARQVERYSTLRGKSFPRTANSGAT